MQSLLRAKLNPPLFGASLVRRPRLERLDDFGPGVKLILVQAPAGFGKTALLTQWHAALNQAGVVTAWLTLDHDDNDVLRFAAYMGNAVATMQAGGSAQGSPERTRAAARQDDYTASELVEQIGGLTQPFVIFLDDFERIQNPEIHSLLRQILDVLPAGARIVLGTRKAPDIGLARLHAHGQMLEFGVDALRFSLLETEAFLRKAHGLGLGAEDLSRLHACSEGWVAGLQLFALAFNATDDPKAFVHRFSGAFADVADYLAEQVLAKQTEDMRAFLLKTSILGRLSGALCDALTGRTDGAQMLQQVEQANLFLQPLDGERRWYRYHTLFSGFLRERLEREQPTEVTQLHHRAALWYLEHEDPVEAVRHALLGGDSDMAARVMAESGHLMITRFGQVSAVIDWVGRLPAAALKGNDRLQLAYGWALCFLHRYKNAAEVLDEIERHRTQWDASTEKEVLALRIAIKLYADQVGEAHRQVEQQFDAIAAGGDFLFGVIANVLAYCLNSSGKFDTAQELLARSRSSHSLAGSEFGAVYAECFEGIGKLSQGQLQTAIARYRAALTRARDVVPGYSLCTAFAAAFLSEALYESDALLEAERLLISHLSHLKECGVIDATAIGYRTLARILHLRGSERDAQAALDELESIALERGAERIVATVGLERIRLALLAGELRKAQDFWQRTQSRQIWQAYEGYCMPANDPETPALAELRLMIHEGNTKAAVSRLKAELKRAEVRRRFRQVLLARILLAAALDAGNERRAALRILRSAVAAAQEEGQIRPFLDEGPAVRSLLVALRETENAQGNPGDGQASIAAFLDRLLGPEPQSKAQTVPAASAPLEALSARERKTLQLVAQGLSNQALADRLCVSETTVRFHLRNAFAKLGAKNRTQAVALARSHGVLE
ncbi:MAG: LuxR C-terminal-related transcriptional regulator [Sterolibacterium sp.]